MNKRLTLLVFIILLMGCILTAGFFRLSTMTKVVVDKPIRDEYEDYIYSTGKVEDAQVQEVFMEWPLLVDYVPVKLGDYVEEGQLLATVDVEKSLAVFSLQEELDLSVFAHFFDSTSEEIQQAIASTAEKLEDAASDYQTFLGSVPTSIYATASGYVTALNLTQNSIVNPLKPVASISTGSQYTIKAFVNESDIAQIFEGQKAVFSTSAYPDREYSAYVTKIYPTARTSVSLSSQETGVDVELLVENPDTFLKAGYTAKVKFITTPLQEVLVVPFEYVLQDEENQEYIYVVENRKAVRKNIQTQLETQDGYIVTNIDPNAYIITAPEMVRKNGQTVLAKKAGWIQ